MGVRISFPVAIGIISRNHAIDRIYDIFYDTRIGVLIDEKATCRVRRIDIDKPSLAPTDRSCHISRNIEGFNSA